MHNFSTRFISLFTIFSVQPLLKVLSFVFFFILSFMFLDQFIQVPSIPIPPSSTTFDCASHKDNEYNEQNEVQFKITSKNGCRNRATQ